MSELIRWAAIAERQRPKITLENVEAPAFWQYVLAGCLPNPGVDSMLGINKSNRFCFYGPCGTGKRTLARAFAGSLMERAGFRFLQADGVEFTGMSPQAIRENVHQLFEVAKKRPGLLMLEHLDEIIWRFVMEECRNIPEDTALYVVVIEEDENLLEEEWKKDLMFCRFGLPTREERVLFFADSANSMPRALGKPSFEWLADNSEGLNYIQLRNVVSLIRMIMKVEAVNEYDGDQEKVYHAYMEGRFGYKEEHFTEVVDMVRRQTFNRTEPKTRTLPIPPIQVNVQGGVGIPMGELPAAAPADTAGEKPMSDDDYFKELFGSIEVKKA